MIKCKECQINPAANFIGICAECLRKASNSESLVNIHESVRERFDLPKLPPHAEAGIRCSLCANNCRMGNGDIGFCGLHYNRAGKRAHRYSTHTALSYMYLDLLPTNCCATWFCQGSKEPGYNLAVFFYGCNFNCLFCQNASHKNLSGATVVTEDEMVAAAIDSRVRCVCFFGGSPEPQLPFSLRTARSTYCFGFANLLAQVHSLRLATTFVHRHLPFSPPPSVLLVNVPRLARSYLVFILTSRFYRRVLLVVVLQTTGYW